MVKITVVFYLGIFITLAPGGNLAAAALASHSGQMV